MRLELEHFKPYLLNGVKCNVKGHSGHHELVRISNNKWLELHEIGRTVTEEYLPKDVEMILRPLSQLQEIDNRNGLDLITLARFVDNGHNHLESKIKKNGSVFRVFTDEIDDIDNVYFSFSGDFNTILGVSIGILPINYNTSLKINNWLVKNHFDISGLLKKGLAKSIK